MSVVAITKGISYFLRFIDVFLVEGIMKGVAGIVQGLGAAMSKLQTGQTQTYVTVAFVGMALLAVIFVLTGGYL
jgi:NADH-quinone oxidoreductase subunit L